MCVYYKHTDSCTGSITSYNSSTQCCTSLYMVFFVTASSCARTKMKTRILHGIVFSSEYESRVLKRPVNTLSTPTSLITRRRFFLFFYHTDMCVLPTTFIEWQEQTKTFVFLMKCVLWHMNKPLVCSTSYACFKKEKRPIWTWTRLHRQHLFQLFWSNTIEYISVLFFSP